VTFAALLSNLKKAEGVSDAHATSIKIVEDLMNGGSSLLPLLERNQATLSQDDKDYLKQLVGQSRSFLKNLTASVPVAYSSPVRNIRTSFEEITGAGEPAELAEGRRRYTKLLSKLQISLSNKVGSTSEHAASLKVQVVPTIIIATLIYFCLVLFAARWVIHKCVRPIRDLAEAANRATDQDTAFTHTINSGPKELNALVRAIRHLIESREARIQELRSVKSMLHHQASHDILTGLPNRAFLIDHLDRCMERARQNPAYHAAVIFMDLDRFKVINDSLGHEAGDYLLINVAKRLGTSLRACDSITRADKNVTARFGGDEFVILLNGLKQPEDALVVAERMQKELTKPLQLEGHEIVTGGSMGIAHVDHTHGKAEDVLRDADTALYRAKARGGGVFALFDDEMRANAIVRMQLENDLRKSVEQNELRLYYQPIVSLKTGRIKGFEGLVRWEKPNVGLVMPGDFINVAEETGMIISIGEWVLKEGTRQLELWQKQFPEHDGLTMSVNFSPKQLLHFDLLARMDRILEGTDIDPKSLNVEITENVVMENFEASMGVIQEIRARQVGLHMDDFGTGYSSLSYLHHMPFDVVKVDRSFATSMRKSSEFSVTIQAIISLCHQSGTKVVVEGIETEVELNRLLELDCDYAQGYYFSKPVPADEAAKMLIGNPYMLPGPERAGDVRTSA
ncbi:MAG: EAL domain-containing protein, partial [Phycisphaerae bacterium]|nr:EAL domain-containing protein [Phycisphaerae bacterium]